MVASVWSAVGFFAGWSSTRLSFFPARLAVTACATWAEVKSYRPTVSVCAVPARKALSVGQPLSGLALSVIVACASTGSRVTPGGPP